MDITKVDQQQRYTQVVQHCGDYNRSEASGIGLDGYVSWVDHYEVVESGYGIRVRSEMWRSGISGEWNYKVVDISERWMDGWITSPIVTGEFPGIWSEWTAENAVTAIVVQHVRERVGNPGLNVAIAKK